MAEERREKKDIPVPTTNQTRSSTMLTSVTTFAGLMPMMFETSMQAQFLIPMAISLGYGILFSTLITLFLVPVNFLMLEDLKRACRWYWRDGSEGTDRERAN